MVLILCKILVLIPRPLPVVDFEMLFDSEGSPSAEIRTKKPHRFGVTLNGTIFQCPTIPGNHFPFRRALQFEGSFDLQKTDG
jgi:hypothetical protein